MKTETPTKGFYIHYTHGQAESQSAVIPVKTEIPRRLLALSQFQHLANLVISSARLPCEEAHGFAKADIKGGLSRSDGGTNYNP